MKVAAVAVILCLPAIQSALGFDTVANTGRAFQQASLKAFTRCNCFGDAGDLMWRRSEPQTSSITVVPIPLLDFAAVVIVILVFFLLAKLRRRRD